VSGGREEACGGRVAREIGFARKNKTVRGGAKRTAHRVLTRSLHVPMGARDIHSAFVILGSLRMPGSHRQTDHTTPTCSPGAPVSGGQVAGCFSPAEWTYTAS